MVDGPRLCERGAVCQAHPWTRTAVSVIRALNLDPKNCALFASYLRPNGVKRPSCYILMVTTWFEPSRPATAPRKCPVVSTRAKPSIAEHVFQLYLLGRFGHNCAVPLCYVAHNNADEATRQHNLPEGKLPEAKVLRKDDQERKKAADQQAK
jgi:hypothetical protein